MKVLLLLLLMCATAWGVEGSTRSFNWEFLESEPFPGAKLILTEMEEEKELLNHKSSTSTCPTVENGVWVGSFEPISHSQSAEYWIQVTTQNCHSYDYTLIKKVPYEIEWECYKQETEYFDCSTIDILKNEKFCSRTWCSRWIGFREDGTVVWKKEE